jgi:hypothetical protein
MLDGKVILLKEILYNFVLEKVYKGNSFIYSKMNKIRDFTVIEKIGEGSFSSVLLVKRNAD